MPIGPDTMGLVGKTSLLEPALKADQWWMGSQGRWFPPYDEKTYGVPQWHEPIVRSAGLPIGETRNPWTVAGLSLVTVGIYFVYWVHASFKDLKSFTGTGVGGGLGLALAFVFPFAFFRLPSEIGHIYVDENKIEPVDGLAGFWVLLPVVGWAVWIIRVQSAMNQIWSSYGGSDHTSKA